MEKWQAGSSVSAPVRIVRKRKPSKPKSKPATKKKPKSKPAAKKKQRPPALTADERKLKQAAYAKEKRAKDKADPKMAAKLALRKEKNTAAAKKRRRELTTEQKKDLQHKDAQRKAESRKKETGVCSLGYLLFVSMQCVP